MSTDTHDLIDKLSADLKPVKQLPRAALRTVILTLWALILALVILRIVHEPRADLQLSLHKGVYLAQGAAILLAGILAAYAAFVLSVPDTRIRLPVKVALGAASAIWLGLILPELFQTNGMPEPAPSCFFGLTLGMSAPLALGLAMLLRSATVWRGWAGFAMVLAVGSFAALGMRFICPNDSPGHLLVWHFLPVIMLALVGIPIGRILLKFRFEKK